MATVPATIHHEEVHVNIDKSSNRPAIITAQYSTSSNVVITDQSGTTVVSQTKADGKRKPKDFVVTSCLVILLCNFVFGLLGWHFGVKANYAWQLGDEDVSKKHAKKAKIFVIVGIIVGIATYALSIGLFFGLRENTDHEVHNSGLTG